MEALLIEENSMIADANANDADYMTVCLDPSVIDPICLGQHRSKNGSNRKEINKQRKESSSKLRTTMKKMWINQDNESVFSLYFVLMIMRYEELDKFDGKLAMFQYKTSTKNPIDVMYDSIKSMMKSIVTEKFDKETLMTYIRAVEIKENSNDNFLNSTSSTPICGRAFIPRNILNHLHNNLKPNIHNIY